MPTMPDAVTASLFYKVRGSVGGKAFIIETSFEKVVLNPKALFDSTLNLKKVLGVSVAVVV